MNDQPPSSDARFFEKSGTDPGIHVASSLPDKQLSLPGDAQSPNWSLEGLAMPMVSHIAELRSRILISVGTLAVMLCLGFTFSLPLIQVFQSMAPKSVVFIQRAPGEVLISSVSVAFYVGVGLSLPIILYHLLRFVLPGLRGHEKSMMIWAILGGTLLFAMGVVFAYYFVVPSALTFLVDYGQTVARPELSIQDYIGFCSSLLFITGVMFELPMVLFLLSFTGLITSEKLIREWQWATVLIFIAAAIVTPTQDPFSMSLVGLAMVSLYALSIIPIRLSGR